MKKLIIIIILIALVIAIALMAPPITSQTFPYSPERPKGVEGSPAPTPKPTPIVKIDSNSNLSEEAKKLNVPDYQPEYDELDKTLSQF